MNKYTTFFEDILKILATFSIILLIAGYLDLKTYYNYFGINISPYISSSEILMSSLDNLIIVFFSMALQVIIWLFFFKHLFDYTEDDIRKYKEDRPHPKNFGDDDLTLIRFLRDKRIRLFVVILFLIALSASVIQYIFSSSNLLFQIGLFGSINLWVFMCIYMLWLPATRYVFRIVKKQGYYNPKLILSGIVFFPVLLSTIWIKNSWFVGNDIRKHGNRNKVELILQNGSTVSPNDSLRYLGRTENYFFFWNKNTWASTIYPAGDVKEIINYKKK